VVECDLKQLVPFPLLLRSEEYIFWNREVVGKYKFVSDFELANPAKLV